MLNTRLWMLALFLSVVCTAQVTFVEYPVLSGDDPRGIAVGPDGNIWFAGGGSARIGRITTAGAITEFSGASGLTQFITGGPDGNLWFTEVDAQKIGRITTAGVITEFSANGGPTGITAGPDGNVWFTEFNGNNIARITPAGVVTEFPVPTSNSGPYDITTGPDGNLWFTEYYGHQIGKITITGVIAEFPIPAGSAIFQCSPGFPLGSCPEGITAGPDGNLWFVEAGAQNIAKITTAGLVTEYPIPTAGYGPPTEITTGPDGNLWFTDYSNDIGRITTAGIITLFPIPTPDSQPAGIVLGPDGNLWFTANYGDTIGRAVISETAGSASLWIGLKNSDDQGTQFDLRAEVYENGALVSSAESRCLMGVTRNPALAKEVTVLLNTALTGFNPGDSLALKILTRIGTNPNDTKCSGPGGSHSSAVGLRLYYDSTDRPSSLTAQIGSNLSDDYFLHSSGSNLILDALPPITNVAKYKDSSALNFAKGNPWKEVGTWSMAVQ